MPDPFAFLDDEPQAPRAVTPPVRPPAVDPFSFLDEAPKPTPTVIPVSPMGITQDIQPQLALPKPKAIDPFGFLDEVKGPLGEVTRQVVNQVVPTATRVGGAIVGGVLGGALGGPGGVIAGGGMGSAAGEALGQEFELATGQRKDHNPVQIAAQGVLGMIPMGKAGTVSRLALRRAGQGALMGGASDVMTKVAEGEDPTLTSVLTGAGLGTVLGAGGGALEARLAGRLPKIPSLSGALEEAAPTHGAVPPKTPFAARAEEIAAIPTVEGTPGKTGGSQMPNGLGGVVTDEEAAINRAMLAPREPMPPAEVVLSDNLNIDGKQKTYRIVRGVDGYWEIPDAGITTPFSTSEAPDAVLRKVQKMVPADRFTIEQPHADVDIVANRAALTPGDPTAIAPKAPLHISTESVDEARRVIAAHEIDSVESAYQFALDDRSHGDEYLAAAAQEISKRWPKSPDGSLRGLADDAEGFLAEANQRARMLQAADEGDEITAGGAPPRVPPPGPPPTPGGGEPPIPPRWQGPQPEGAVPPATPEGAPLPQPNPRVSVRDIERKAEVTGDPIPAARPLPESRKVEERMVAHLPEEQRADTLRVIEEHSEDIASQRRGVVPNARTEAIAQWGDAERTKLAPGTILNAEDSTRLNLAVARVNDDISAIAMMVAANEASPKDLLQLEKLRLDQAILIQNRLGVQAEVGRALQAQKIFTQALASKDDALLEEALKLIKPDDLKQFAKEWGALGDDISKIDFIRKRQPMTTWEKFQSVRYANMLSGVKTQLRNLIGTAVNGAFRTASHGAAAGYDLAKSAATGSERTVFFSEMKPRAVATLVGMQRGLKSFAFTMKHGFNPQAIETFDIPRAELRGGIKNPFNAPGRMLEAVDAFMYDTFYSQELAGQLYANLRKKGMKDGIRGRALDDFIKTGLADGLVDPPPDIAKSARQTALEILYREEGPKITKILQQAKRDGGLLGKFLDVLVPFTKVPINLMAQSVENVPGGAVLTSRGRAALRGGGRAQAEMIGREAVGGIALLSLATMAMQGRLSGNGPDSPTERAWLMKQGWQPNSVKIGDKWIPYGTAFQSIAAPLFAVANFWERWQAGGHKITEASIEDLTKLGATSGMAAIGSALDQSFLSGLADFTNAVNDPGRFAMNYLGRTAQSAVVPLAGLERNIAQTIDPVVRQPTSLTDQLKVAIPGLSQQVAPKIDPFGQQVERAGGRAAGMSPIVASTESKDPVIAGLKRAGVVLGEPVKKLDESRRTPAVTLTPEERMAIGQAVYAAAKRFTGNKAWLAMADKDPAQAARAVENALNQAREQQYMRIRMMRRRGK